MKAFEDNLDQSKNQWNIWWKDLTPEKEIQKWDYYGLRPWIIKYVPRNGKRFVFILRWIKSHKI